MTSLLPQHMDERKKSILPMASIIIIIVFLSFLGSLVTLYTDFLWFEALGYAKIFSTILKTKILLFFFAAIIFFLFAWINIFIAKKLRKDNENFIPYKTKLYILLALSFFVGMGTSGKWFVYLQYLKQVPFSLADPIFAKDVAFYVFSLPFYEALWRFSLSCIILTLMVIALDYLQAYLATFFNQPKEKYDPIKNIKSVSPKSQFPKLKRKPLIHLIVLGSFLFILFSIKHYLNKFSVMYSEQGIVVGAGYTDVVVYLPIVKILMVLAILIAVMFYVWIFYISKQPKIRKRHILLYAIATYVVLGLIAPPVLQGIVQSLRVDPNEFNLEKPFLENNIEFTKIAYGLNDVDEQDFEVTLDLTREKLESETLTVDNIRILDWRPLTQTYKQMQEIRLYYDLSGIDIDRYMIGDKYRQVMIAPRELDQKQITEEAKTWVNLHMVYTHGYGVVMSPVNKVTNEGLPEYLIKDIPPVYEPDVMDLKIERPQIYYGEQDNKFVLVNTKTPEFDYPKGNENEYTHYSGKGGVVLDSFFKKLMMSIRFKDIKILISSEITDQSKIMFTRNIKNRVAKLTPFLVLDDDPYIVINEGKLLWIQDAYTVTGNFPYSQKQGYINYMRNSVKIVVDSYDGTVTYYIMDDNEPLMKTFSNIFPGEFKAFSELPESLKQNLRYPEGLFKIQSKVYSTYHMKDPKVFYNKEDAWQIPNEIYGTGQQIPVEPYYIIMKLPGETKEEFVLMNSYTPIKKNNMNAWLAARSDGSNYGKLLLFKFPKDKLIYGPSQIEAKFDQDSDISEQLTLWSQQGSSVTRGNLLVIPIQDSILYIEPLYIQADKGQLPELKRVLVSDGERVVMEKTLDIALESLFGKSTAPTETADEEKPDESAGELANQAQDYYENILKAMEDGDWAGIGENLDKLGLIIEELNK